MPEYKYINTAAIEDISGGDQELALDIILMFLKGAPELLLDIQKNLTEENYQEIATAAHKLRPMFAYVGARNTMGKMEEIETQSNQEEPIEMLSSRISKIENEMADIIRELNTFKSSLASG